MEQALTRSWLMNALCFATGITLVYIPCWVTGLVVGLTAALLYWRLSPYRTDIIAALLIVALGWGYASWHQLPLAPHMSPQDDILISGTVLGYPRVQEERSSFVVKTEQDSPYLKRLQVFCNFEVSLQPGTAVQLRGSLKKPSEPGNPGEFDYPRYLARHHIYYLLQVQDQIDLQVQIAPTGLSRLAPLLRSRMVEKTRQVLPPQEAALTLGMVLGIIDNLDEDLYQDFQKTGLVHLFAVSGLNIGFIVIFAVLINRIGGLSRRAGFFTTMALIFLYSSLTGWPVSVQRAFIMASLSLLAVYLGRGHLPTNGLGLAALVILVMDPCALFTISFQLSFLATWGLVALYPAIKKFLHYENRCWDLVLVPICAQLAVLPLIAYYFHLITPVSLLSNLLVTYVAGGIVILGFAALLLVLPCPALAALLLIPTGICARLLLWINAVCKSLPLAYWIVATPPLFFIVAYFVGLLWLLWGLQHQASPARLKMPVLVMGLAVLMLLVPPWWLHKNEVWLTVIDVGQGDSILIKSPHNRFILIDGGGSMFSDIGRRKVLPLLNHLGVNRLFMVINTHADVDHIKGLEEVMADRKVDHVGLAAVSMQEPEAQNLLGLARQQGSEVVALQQGQILKIDDLKLEVWYPKGDLPSTLPLNDQSLVLHCRFGNFTALLTGDQSRENLEQVWRQYRERSLVVKAPHHGSRYAWFSALGRQAEWVIISAGANNMFGHPHQEVLQDIARGKARLLRTDQHGAITMHSDGQTIKIKTFK